MTDCKFYPFRFARLKNNQILLINDFGDWIVLNSTDFQKIIDKQLDLNSTVGLDLQSRDFLTEEYTFFNLKRLAHRYRTKKKYLFDSTALHMLVMTHRCNHKCKYCQASSHETSGQHLDMSTETAKKCIDVSFESPSKYIKIEFQGGEPLLNKQVVFDTILYAKNKNIEIQKDLEFVICTNLTTIDSDVINFLKDNHNVQISTSLDGSEALHNQCRVYPSNHGTYQDFLKKLNLIRRELPFNQVAALTTISKYNLYQMKDIVDTYKNLSFNSIFLRPLNPFGFAKEKWTELAYPVEDFIEEYIKTLDYIIKLNEEGYFIREEFASIFLYKILTPYSSGFVDIQSPSGLGIAGAIYEINGDVFVSDEARMLFRSSGNKKYCLGNAVTKNRREIYSNLILKDILLSSTIEALPGCAWCAFQPYCGTDPIKNFVQFGNDISHKAYDENCKLYKAIMTKLFEILASNDERKKDILYSWINNTDNLENKDIVA